MYWKLNGAFDRVCWSARVSASRDIMSMFSHQLQRPELWGMNSEKEKLSGFMFSISVSCFVCFAQSLFLFLTGHVPKQEKTFKQSCFLRDVKTQGILF